MGLLKNKYAIVTGAASARGLGKATAQMFAEHGATIAILDLDADAAKAAAADLGKGHVGLACNVTDKDACNAAIQTLMDSWGRTDNLVNNADIAQRRGAMEDLTEQEFDHIFAVNVKSIYLTALHGLALLRRRPGGNIVNIASIAAISPRAGLTWYNGLKGAVWTLTKSMAAELAPEKIRVNAVNPVIGETGLTEAFMGGDTPELRQKFISTIPLGRMSTPRDIANAALFLLSDEASFITGAALPVDGGVTA